MKVRTIGAGSAICAALKIFERAWGKPFYKVFPKEIIL
jgi:hypothetical protein